jgi:hypothetical protein
VRFVRSRANNITSIYLHIFLPTQVFLLLYIWHDIIWCPDVTMYLYACVEERERRKEERERERKGIECKYI